jgi:hypothetical protein
MPLSSDEHVTEVDGVRVTVMGTTGPAHATWTLSVADEEQDTARGTGDIVLRGTLPDGSGVTAEVSQGLVGPTTVRVLHDGELVKESSGFVA